MTAPLRALVQLLAFAWASPWTVLGLLVGALAIATGGGAQRVGRTVEVYGGVLRWFLAHAPVVGRASALTLGHTILGQTRGLLSQCRAHELVHVRQDQLWGPLFVPAYLLASLVQRLRGRDPYRDNPFEREAYRKAP